MKIITSKTYWINRLYTNKDELSLIREEFFQNLTTFLNTTIYKWFNNDFFTHSILIKDSKLKLSIAGLNPKTYSFWKGLLVSIG